MPVQLALSFVRKLEQLGEGFDPLKNERALTAFDIVNVRRRDAQLFSSLQQSQAACETFTTQKSAALVIVIYLLLLPLVINALPLIERKKAWCAVE